MLCLLAAATPLAAADAVQAPPTKTVRVYWLRPYDVPPASTAR